jgi:hypothetical protein
VLEAGTRRWGGCTAAFGAGTEERRAFGRFGSASPPRRWRHAPGGEFDGVVSGAFGDYGTGGYVATPLAAEGALPAVYASDAAEAGRLLDGLLAGGWVDRHTRMVVVDWTLADTQVGLLTSVKLIAEYSPIGRVVGTSSIKTIRHVPVFDTASTQAWAELVFVLMVLMYLIAELRDISRYLYLRAKLRRLKLHKTPAGMKQLRDADYFGDPWNVVDVINYVLFLFGFLYEFGARRQLQAATDQLSALYSPGLRRQGGSRAFLTPLGIFLPHFIGF